MADTSKHNNQISMFESMRNNVKTTPKKTEKNLENKLEEKEELQKSGYTLRSRENHKMKPNGVQYDDFFSDDIKSKKKKLLKKTKRIKVVIHIFLYQLGNKWKKTA